MISWLPTDKLEVKKIEEGATPLGNNLKRELHDYGESQLTDEFRQPELIYDISKTKTMTRRE